MKAHIVGGGFGGLAAAAYLIRNAGVSGQDITIYEADERMGGRFFRQSLACAGRRHRNDRRCVCSHRPPAQNRGLTWAGCGDSGECPLAGIS
jgi:monoamine oxidase